MNVLPIRIVESPAEAPNYRNSDFMGARLTEAVIVKKGTEAGKPTVDLVFEVIKPDGTVTDIAVAMTTGTIVEMLASAIKGAQ